MTATELHAQADHSTSVPSVDSQKENILRFILSQHLTLIVTSAEFPIH